MKKFDAKNSSFAEVLPREHQRSTQQYMFFIFSHQHSLFLKHQKRQSPITTYIF